jgi:hypothetical protein
VRPTGIGRIGANGAIALFPIPTSNSGPSDIISGPDGALWFTEPYANKIGRVTTDGVLTEYTLPAPPGGLSCNINGEFVGPLRMTVGPDGALWFTEPCTNRIGRFTIAPATPPTAGGVSPAQGSGTSADFTFTFSDASGWQNLVVVNMLINSALDGRKACYLAYAVPSSTLLLVDDAGDAGGPYAGSVTVGNAGTYIANSQCAVSLNSAVGCGADLTLMLTVRFQPAFGRNLIRYLAARDSWPRCQPPVGRASSEYNQWNAPHLCNAAGGSVQLFADQSGGVRIGCRLKAPGVLQTRREACLRDEGDRIRRRQWPPWARSMPFLSYREGDAARPDFKFTRSFPSYLCRTPQSSGFAPTD